MLKRTCGLPRLGGDAVGPCCAAKGLQALDMDAVLPVAHLEHEEVHPAADDGVWAVVQWREGGVVAVTAY